MRRIAVAALVLGLVWPVAAGAADSDIEAWASTCRESCGIPYPYGAPATTRATPKEKAYMACVKRCADKAAAAQFKRKAAKAAELRAERMRKVAALNAQLDAMVQEIADYRRQVAIARHWARNEKRFRKKACPRFKNPSAAGASATPGTRGAACTSRRTTAPVSTRRPASPSRWG